MHELSIIINIIDAAEEQVSLHRATRVESIELEIGTLAGIEERALEFARISSTPNTVLDGAAWHIIRLQARARCTDCGHEFDQQQIFEPCPLCNGYFSDLIRGRELKIKSMTLV